MSTVYEIGNGYSCAAFISSDHFGVNLISTRRCARIAELFRGFIHRCIDTIALLAGPCDNKAHVQCTVPFHVCMSLLVYYPLLIERMLSFTIPPWIGCAWPASFRY